MGTMREQVRTSGAESLFSTVWRFTHAGVESSQAPRHDLACLLKPRGGWGGGVQRCRSPAASCLNRSHSRGSSRLPPASSAAAAPEDLIPMRLTFPPGRLIFGKHSQSRGEQFFFTAPPHLQAASGRLSQLLPRRGSCRRPLSAAVSPTDGRHNIPARTWEEILSPRRRERTECPNC